MTENSLTLSELTQEIKTSINRSFPGQFWIVAEISEINMNRSGHAYLELVEKDPVGDQIIARMRATIWAYTFRLLRPYFENATGYSLSAGQKIMVRASVEFHDLYSLSLNIKDIDPGYTLGDLAKKKIQILNRLSKEGVLDMNKMLPFPVVPQRIAVISSETAAGFGDFMNSLDGNKPGFRFNITLYSAVMQGDKTAASVITALDRIYENEEDYDLVVIIRGGGAQADLDSFNHYDLAYHITQFPLPVITGIGHERDDTVTDTVAHTKLKTPTAVAEFLIDKMTEFFELLKSYEERVLYLSTKAISDENNILNRFMRSFSMIISKNLSKNQAFLERIHTRLKHTSTQHVHSARQKLIQQKRITALYSENILQREKREQDLHLRELLKRMKTFFFMHTEKLLSLEKTTDYLNPGHILKRGFSITTKNGKAVKNAENLSNNEMIETIFYKGKISSIVKKQEKTDKNED